jgi:hypothetical protein
MQYTSNIRRFLTTGAMLSALLVMLLLAACGSSTGGQGSPGGTTPSPSTGTTNCGTLHESHAGLDEKDKPIAAQAENCFYQAYQQCRNATLTFMVSSIDTGTIHKFAVSNNGGKCTITDGTQHYVAPNPPGATIEYTCSTMTQEADGLHIQSCGAANTVVVPAK